MTHDPLCPMQDLIHTESERVRAKNAAGTPVLQPHYTGDNPYQTDEAENDCQCDLVSTVRADTLAKCVAAVEACADNKGFVYSANEIGIDWALEALRALQRSKP